LFKLIFILQFSVLYMFPNILYNKGQQILGQVL